MIDEIIRGLVSTPMENMDQFVTGEITNHLFEDRHIPHSGVDLIALNIQRGEACVYTALWHDSWHSGDTVHCDNLAVLLAAWTSC